MSKQQKKESKKKQANVNVALKYSGMAFQMLAIILIFTFLGKWIDEKYQFDPPLATIGFALFSVIAALYLSLKDLMKNN